MPRHDKYHFNVHLGKPPVNFQDQLATANCLRHQCLDACVLPIPWCWYSTQRQSGRDTAGDIKLPTIHMPTKQLSKLHPSHSVITAVLPGAGVKEAWIEFAKPKCVQGSRHLLSAPCPIWLAPDLSTPSLSATMLVLIRAPRLIGHRS